MESCKFPLGLVAEKLSGRSYQAFENIPCVVSNRQMVPCLPAEIVPEEKPPDRIEHTTGHFQHILHHFLHLGVGDRHVHGTDGDHEVETGDDVSGILDELVQFWQVMSAGCVSFIKVVGQVSERIENGHIFGR